MRLRFKKRGPLEALRVDAVRKLDESMKASAIAEAKLTSEQIVGDLSADPDVQEALRTQRAALDALEKYRRAADEA